jgi:hypothetical protein
MAKSDQIASSGNSVVEQTKGAKATNPAMLQKELIPKLQTTIDRMLNSVINTETGNTVKDEALDILKESIGHLKEQLRRKIS